MSQHMEITVRRAKVSDAENIAAFVNRFSRGREIERMEVIERFGNVGFLLAEQGAALVGLLGWQVENLVVRVTDFLIGPVSDRVAVGQALLAEMESAAGELQCETVLLFLPRPIPPALAKFCETLGYEPQVVADLPRAWQEAAQEGRLGERDTIFLKRLREDRVVRPL